MLNGRVNRNPMTRSVCIAAAIALLSITVPIAGFQVFAQTFSTVSGSVVDQHGGLLPDVRLVLSNVQSKAKYEIRSNRTGQFEFVGLPDGDYVLEVEVPGFRTFRDSLTVGGRNPQRNIELQIGTLEETITVSGATGGQRPRAAAPNDLVQQLDDLAATVEARRRFQRVLEECSASAAASGPPVGGNIRPPRKIGDARPRYPESLREARIGGIVKLEARIGTDGYIREVQSVDPSVHPDLVNAAIDAVNQWQFDGTLLNCVPVEVSMTVSVYFNPEQ